MLYHCVPSNPSSQKLVSNHVVWQLYMVINQKALCNCYQMNRWQLIISQISLQIYYTDCIYNLCTRNQHLRTWLYEFLTILKRIIIYLSTFYLNTGYSASFYYLLFIINCIWIVILIIFYVTPIVKVLLPPLDAHERNQVRQRFYQCQLQ